MATSPHHQKTSPQAAASAALAAALQPGEELLEGCTARFNTGFFSSQELWIGLTGRRFIFIPTQKSRQVYSLYFAFIDAVTELKKGRVSLLSIRLRPAAGAPPLKEALTFLPSSPTWHASLRRMVEKYAALPAWEAFRFETFAARQAVQQVGELRGLGALNASQDLLQALMKVRPSLRAEPGARDLLKGLRALRLSMRLAAGMFAIVVLFLVYLAIQGQANLSFGILLAVLAIIDLLRGKPSGRTLALVLGLMTAGLNAALSLGAGSPLDAILWGSFGLAMLLLLLGSPDRLRIAAAVTAFTVGSVGIFVFVTLGGRAFPGAFNAFAPPPSGPFVDDFSTDQKWTQTQTDAVTAGLENGAYAILVKQPSLSYLSFPPVTFSPGRAEVDVVLPEGSLSASSDAYGLICRYQKNAGKYYVVYIRPWTEEFAIFRVENNTPAPLTDPPLQALQGLKAAGLPNRVGLACQDNRVTLTLNGAQQAQLSDPQMAQFGAGQLGLMVSTFEQVPAGGFKVLFDNASFWP